MCRGGVLSGVRWPTETLNRTRTRTRTRNRTRTRRGNNRYDSKVFGKSLGRHEVDASLRSTEMTPVSEAEGAGLVAEGAGLVWTSSDGQVGGLWTRAASSPLFRDGGRVPVDTGQHT